LRLISFNLDRYWSQDKGHANSVEVFIFAHLAPRLCPEFELICPRRSSLIRPTSLRRTG
jgi:hypothetical protein